jgi:hypothetical protein
MPNSRKALSGRELQFIAVRKWKKVPAGGYVTGKIGCELGRIPHTWGMNATLVLKLHIHY